VLVAAAVITGIQLARWRAAKVRIDPAVLESFIGWMLAAGFIGGHVFDTLFYYPERVLARPWSLFFLWENLSSFGGFAGGLIGMFLWKRYKYRGRPILPLIELIASVYPVAWILGRMGCATVHDHPGKLARNWLSVAFPGGPRYDLGLLEAMFAAVLSAALALTWSKPKKQGFYLTVICLSYGPVRFAMDRLRIADARYLGFTPGQWASIAVFATGLVLLWRTYFSGRPRPTVVAPA
jgi:phosphatidylglycerol:prolipoprotein diacylglycerol transferase